MPKRRLTRIRLDKIAAVDLPCQEHATVGIIKRAPVSAVPAIAKATFQEALRAQLVSGEISEVFCEAFDQQWAVREAFAESMTDELAAGGDGSQATEGFVAAMRTIAETAVTLAREAATDPANQNLESAVEQAVEKWLAKQETEPMKITTKAALKAAVAAFNPETSTVADLTAIHKAATELNAEDELPVSGPLAKAQPQAPELTKALREIDVLKMSPEMRKHYEGLDEAGQDAFIAKDASGREADMAKANEADPVVYTCTDGTQLRKSDGSAAVMLAKRTDEQAKEIEKLRNEGATDRFEKQAVEKYPNVAKATAVALLKSADRVGLDTDEGKDVLKSLESMNKSRRGAFQTVGDEGGAAPGSEGIAKARQTFDGEVKKIAERDKCDTATAMSKARVEHPDLFKEAYPDTAAAGDREFADDED